MSDTDRNQGPKSPPADSSAVATSGAAKRISSARLIERFCTDVPEGYVADPGTTGNVSRGFCGYLGGSGDGMVTGFDSGDEFAAALSEGGWTVLSDLGNWPYVIHAIYKPFGATLLAHAHYCEGDLTVTTFSNIDGLRKHCEREANGEVAVGLGLGDGDKPKIVGPLLKPSH